MHFNGETMKYLNTGLVCEQSGLSCVELPKICIPVYREVIKEMAEVIKDSQMRDVFYSLSTGIDILAVSKKTGVAPRNLAYMYKKASRQVRLEWKSYSEWKQELDRVYIRCRNYAALLTHSQEWWRTEFQECSDSRKGTGYSVGMCRLVSYTFRKFGYKFQGVTCA